MPVLIYATVEDMIDRFSEEELCQLTDYNNIPLAVIDRSRVEKALEDAQAEIDGYVGMVYKLPLKGCLKKVVLPGHAPEYVAPPKLRNLACDIARYYLYDDIAPEHEVFRRYEMAKKDLREIADGKAMLSCPLGGSPGETITVDPLNVGGETYYFFSARRVTDETTRGYK